jgi:hypothetical protein
MAQKRRQTDRGAVAALDQVLLGLSAGQLLLEPVTAKRPGEPALRPVAAQPAASAEGTPRKRPPAAMIEPDCVGDGLGRVAITTVPVRRSPHPGTLTDAAPAATRC